MGENTKRLGARNQSSPSKPVQLRKVVVVTMTNTNTANSRSNAQASFVGKHSGVDTRAATVGRRSICCDVDKRSLAYSRQMKHESKAAQRAPM